jgi:hypothetical protein
MNDPSRFVVGLPPSMLFGMTLERIYHLVRGHLRLFLAIGSVIAAAMLGVYIAFGAVIGFSGLIPKSTNPDPTRIMHAILPLELLLAVPILVVFALYLAATLYAALNADAAVTVTFRQSYAAAWHRAGRYIWLVFWIYLRAFGPALLTMLILFGGSGLIVFLTPNQGSNLMLALVPLGILLAIALYVYGIIVALRLSLAIPAAISENLTASAALRRSTQLTYGAKGRIFLVLLVVDLICGLGIFAVEVVAILLGVVAVAVGSAFHMQVKEPITIVAIVLGGLVIAVLFLMVIVITYSALIASLAVLYNDQRRRYDSLLSPAPVAYPPAGPA